MAESGLPDEPVRDIINKNVNTTGPFTISYSSTSFANGSTIASEAPQIPMPVAIDEISVYDVRTKLQRHLILAALSVIAFLLPFCDTIYLPALDAIKEDLKTSDTLVATSVSIYLLMSGIFSLLWGSVSDRFGRKITLIIALIVFVAVSIVCIFAPNIIVLIVFRAIQGATVSVTLVVGQGLVADIYPEKRRASAAGFFFLPFNIGPVVGPLIGGPLSGAFGWRSTFIFLTIFSFCVLIVIFVFVPETHQYFVKERFHKLNPHKRIADAMPNEIPPFEKPWKALTFLADLTIAPYIAVATMTFATLFSSITLFSNYLREVPYSYTETIIGVLFVPSGVTLFASSLLGGWLSDKVSKYYGHGKCPEARLMLNLALCILTPIGLLIYGWSFHYKVHLSGPIIGLMLLSFGQGVFEPSVSTYLTIKKQKDAAAVSAANTCLNFCAAGVLVSVGVPLVNAMGTGPYFSLLCGLNVIAIVPASILVYKCIRRARCVVAQQSSMASGLENPNESTSSPRNGYVIPNN